MYVHVHAANWRASCAPPFGLFLRTLAAPQGAPFGRHPAAEAKTARALFLRVSFLKKQTMSTAELRKSFTSRELRREEPSATCCRCFCGRMPPKWGPCGAASGWRKSPKGRAQDAREGAARTGMCAQRPPEPAREVGGQDARRPRYLGCVSFGYLSLHKQRKVTRSPQASESFALQDARSRWIPAFAGMTANRKELDSGLRRNDDRGNALQ